MLQSKRGRYCPLPGTLCMRWLLLHSTQELAFVMLMLCTLPCACLAAV